MSTGAIIGHIDVAQIVLYLFWLFFAGLIIYLRREDRREGYPLVFPDRTKGRPPRANDLPKAKVFRTADGHTYYAPPGTIDDRPIAAVPAEKYQGAPLIPTGDPMRDGVGPASYAMRQDVPDTTSEGKDRIVPLRADPHHYVAEEDPNPVGMWMVGADGKLAGMVKDLWIDRSEPSIKYLELEVTGPAGPRSVLFPMPLANVSKSKREVRTGAVLAHQFADAPATKDPDRITKLEEDMISGYFAGGYMYATPQRQEPLL